MMKLIMYRTIITFTQMNDWRSWKDKETKLHHSYRKAKRYSKKLIKKLSNSSDYADLRCWIEPVFIKEQIKAKESL